METKKDIENIEDIKLMVNDFYDKVKKDPLLSPIFFERIPADWQPHLDKMYLFWNAALFGEKGYVGNPFSKHATMDTITQTHFNKWLFLFYETIDTYFSGAIATETKRRANIMADTFMRRLTEARNNGTRTIV